MAKFSKGILGPISGKIGPVIGSSWKGIPYLKAVTKNPKVRVPTPAQLAHQKFIFLTRWLRPLHPYIISGFRNLAKHFTEINAAFSHNFKEAVLGSGDSLHIDYQNVRISMGRLSGIEQPSLTLMDENILQLSWQNIEEPLSAHNDQLMLVVYNDEQGIADGFTGGVKRSAQVCRFTVDQRLAGKSFHVFVGLIALNGRKISDSQYLGKIEPL
jgi:hypothetical protein